ncbi:hypothetical protein LTR90_006908 [Exophiala xenobiotica]|nr:hypothetical protein LTS06_011893 [Exophiala xenobiotica]KAK5412787.1 hypothetical protein LTR90_006908 [Exophiala xenobiotica]
MLIDLQYEGELLSSPTLPALNMLFPISGRRGESYATGTYENKQPLAFSVTYEGPIMLLWLHYITWLENARFYNMHVLSICHTTIQSTTREVFGALAGVMRWASTEFLDDVGAQLLLVWKAANRQTT